MTGVPGAAVTGQSGDEEPAAALAAADDLVVRLRRLAQRHLGRVAAILDGSQIPAARRTDYVWAAREAQRILACTHA